MVKAERKRVEVVEGGWLQVTRKRFSPTQMDYLLLLRPCKCLLHHFAELTFRGVKAHRALGSTQYNAARKVEP